MVSWHTVVANDILPVVAGDCFWEDCLREIINNDTSPSGLHLAVFVEPYLSYILEGKKTVESRFGVRRYAPYGQVASGDILLLKESSGPIVGLCRVSNVWFYNLNPSSWQHLRSEFTEALCAQDPNFWSQREKASFATLMQIDCVRAIERIPFPKQDRRGWVVLRPSGLLFHAQFWRSSR